MTGWEKQKLSICLAQPGVLSAEVLVEMTR